MKCPYCDHEFSLTWSRYLKAPMGRHTCPACKRESKLSITRGYLVKSLLPVFALTLVAAKLSVMLFPSAILAAPIAIMASLLIGIPWDKHCDEKRELKRVVPAKF